MKRLSLCLIAVLFFFNMGAICYASSAPYVGNKSTKVYHMVECTWVKKMGTGNRIYFDSREKAEIRGYYRCHYCGDGFVEEGNDGGSVSGSSGSSGHSSSQKPSSNSGTSNKETSNSDPLAWIVLGGIGIWVIIWLFKNRQKPKANKTIAIPASTPPATKEVSDASPELQAQIKSSFIKKVSYSSKGLHIEFHGGSKYTYYNAPKRVYEELIRSNSPGSYFHTHISGVYPYELHKD